MTVAELEGHARFLADGLLEGRGAGTRGAEVAALYHESQFRALSLAPAFGNSYGQPFELVGSTPDPEPRLEIDGVEPLTAWQDFVVGSHREDVGEQLSGQLVYAGLVMWVSADPASFCAAPFPLAFRCAPRLQPPAAR